MIQDNSVLLHDAGLGQWMLYQNPAEVLAARHTEDVPVILREVERRVNEEGLHAAGFVAYEAAPAFDPALAVIPGSDFPLAWFGLYAQAEPVSAPSLVKPPPEIDWSPSITEDQYNRGFNQVKDHIRAGQTYQVNYSYRLRAPFSGDPFDLFAAMIRAQGSGYGAFLSAGRWAICSASPELFFTLGNGVLLSRPMKGTSPRGLTLEEDRRRADQLVTSGKDRAENLMIVDMVRHDMGQVARMGSVRVPRLFEVEKYPTLWQMTSSVECRTGSGLVDILESLFPAASITGAPKVRTMEIIASLEDSPRRIYTGAIGFLSPRGRAQFNVAIRTALIDRTAHTAEYGVGGGIVWDSRPDSELRECRTKARVLARPAPEFDLLETLLWTPEEGYAFLDEHLERLAASAEYFSRRVNPGQLRGQLKAFAQGLDKRPHRVRLLMPERGPVKLEAKPLTPLPEPYRLALARRPAGSGGRFLYHKTTCREVYERALA